jgi:response regulator RpfG family c-di-GMP phosphodiesterase
VEGIVTTIAVRHSVADFDTWKAGFDDHEKVRRSHGSTGHQVLRDDNHVLALIEFPDVASAEAFQDDPSLAQAMHDAGVVSTPDISVWSEVAEERY